MMRYSTLKQSYIMCGTYALVISRNVYLLKHKMIAYDQIGCLTKIREDEELDCVDGLKVITLDVKK